MRNAPLTKPLEQSNMVYFERIGIYELFSLNTFPYASYLSLEPLITYWKTQLGTADESNRIIAEEIERQLHEAPSLFHPIKDLSVLNKHDRIVDLLISGFLPSMLEKEALARISSPFHVQCFFETEPITQLVSNPDAIFQYGSSAARAKTEAVVLAGNIILNRCYGIPFPSNYTFSITVDYQNAPIQRHFQGKVYLEYVQVDVNGELPELSAEEIQALQKNLDEVEPWLQTFPPDKFSFRGISCTHLFDNTESEIISLLERSLLERNAILEAHKMEHLQDLLCSYFKHSPLKIGISALDYPLQANISKYPLHHFLLQRFQPEQFIRNVEGSPYETALKEQTVLVFEDLNKEVENSALFRDLVRAGFQSLLIAPLFNAEEKVIGLLELGSPVQGALDQLAKLKIKEFTGLFGIAVERVRKEIDNQIHAIIRKEFTGIHPSVEWQFESTALQMLEQENKGEETHSIEPIVFQDIYPLYGQADIVGSSYYRNKAIQQDLLENLDAARDTLQQCGVHCYFPTIEALCVEADRYIQDLKKHLTSSNEFHSMTFLKNEIHPLLEIIAEKGDELRDIVEDYYTLLDTNMGIIYRRRKDYEATVSVINSTISSMLDDGQEKAQEIIPHFYDKYQTDGVAYNIYAGQSLLQEGDFSSEIHLSNLRLWQLESLCQITQKLEKIKDRLPIPLRTAQLILVHSTPLSIRFRMDEKRFDVDGTYNARYEIVKKRIDKAYVEGTDQRLTLAGKIAIVLQFEEDIKEYKRYIQYLIEKGYILEEVEELHIQKLQGVSGLTALRITIKPMP